MGGGWAGSGRSKKSRRSLVPSFSQRLETWFLHQGQEEELETWGLRGGQGFSKTVTCTCPILSPMWP